MQARCLDVLPRRHCCGHDLDLDGGIREYTGPTTESFGHVPGLNPGGLKDPLVPLLPGTAKMLRIFYMALPCALTLLPASLYASHPVDWPNFGVLTDWEAR